MNETVTRGQLATLYLLGFRDEALRERVPPEQRQSQLARGLTDPDRTVRAKWLARCVADLASELSERRLV